MRREFSGIDARLSSGCDWKRKTDSTIYRFSSCLAFVSFLGDHNFHAFSWARSRGNCSVTRTAWISSTSNQIEEAVLSRPGIHASTVAAAAIIPMNQFEPPIEQR
jgi:hypothetical protein